MNQKENLEENSLRGKKLNFFGNSNFFPQPVTRPDRARSLPLTLTIFRFFKPLERDTENLLFSESILKKESIY